MGKFSNESLIPVHAHLFSNNLHFLYQLTLALLAFPVRRVLGILSLCDPGMYVHRQPLWKIKHR